ncbi:hypothetical protein [Brevundimonas sp. DC300-4]|uniref:hypothetical protein n=1 Tax=Brevundimonas sp. DC300-4 TaxID=2804594 RepID=UPI003CF8F72C
MTAENGDDLRSEMRANANAHAEASVYTLNNPYLTAFEKAQVEAIYQFPIGVMGFSFGALALFGEQSLYFAYLNSSFHGFLAWVVARYKPGNLVPPLGFITGGWVMTIINLALAGYALYLERWGVAAFMGLSAFGITSAVMLPLWLWHLDERRLPAGQRMHAKYLIAKRRWGMSFPFEARRPV